MSNDVVLSAALRNNLLSLQNTQSQINTHQQRLATGKKVNSALDNPQSFFAAQSLTNRANDLSNLLDSIGQSIQVINAANNGVTALSSLINQAQSLANTAQSTLAGASTQATVTGSVNLGTGKLSLISGVAAGGTSELQITVTDPKTGAAIALPGVPPGQVVIGANDTASDLVTKINDLNTNLSSPVVSASLDSGGHLVVTATNSGTLNVKFGDTTFPGTGFAGGSAADNTADLSLASALGFAGIAKLNQNGATAAANSSVDFTQTATSTLTSQGLFTASGVLAQASSTLASLTDSTGAPGSVSALSATDTLTISVGGHTSANLLGANAPTQSIQAVIDAINHDSNIDSLVSASFDATTGKISLTPLTVAATDAQFKFSNGPAVATADKLNLGFGTGTFTNAASNGAASTEDIRFGAAAGTLQSLQTQYNTTLAQIDALVKDTGYAGTNLLQGNSLTTFFNENRTTSLTTQGVTFTSAGLKLTAGNFQSTAGITESITQTQEALTSVRNFGGTLATNLSVIQDRQTFTTSLINTLQTGSDQLTNADQNAEGASLLALQTRQSLGVTSLSLASQAQQAILKLF